MSASPIPTREHGLQLPPRQRNWIRVWSLKHGMVFEQQQCTSWIDGEGCALCRNGYAPGVIVSARELLCIEAAEMEAAQVEKETEYWE